MKKIIAPLFALLLPATGLASPLAEIDGQSITTNMVLSANPAAAHDPAAQKQTLRILIDRALLAKIATQQELDKTPEVHAALEVQREQVLANAAAAHFWQTHPITAAALHSAYQKAVAALPKREFRLREIVVHARSEAESILNDLHHGQDFSMLASQHSVLTNKAIGGETGWVVETAVPAYLLSILEHAKNGTVYGPVNTPGGWMIVQKLGERSVPVPTFQEVEPKLLASLRNQELDHYVESLNKKMKK